MFDLTKLSIASTLLLILLVLPNIAEACSPIWFHDFTFSCENGNCQLEFVEESMLFFEQVSFLGERQISSRPISVNASSSYDQTINYLQPAAGLEAMQANGLFRIHCFESGCEAAEPISQSLTDAIAGAKGSLLESEQSYATQVNRKALFISSFVAFGLILSVWQFGIYKTSFIACLVFFAAGVAHFGVPEASCDYGNYDARENWLPLMMFAGTLLGVSIRRRIRDRVK